MAFLSYFLIDTHVSEGKECVHGERSESDLNGKEESYDHGCPTIRKDNEWQDHERHRMFSIEFLQSPWGNGKNILRPGEREAEVYVDDSEHTNKSAT